MQLLERYKEMPQLPRTDILSRSFDTAKERLIDTKKRTRRRGIAVDFDDTYCMPAHVFKTSGYASMFCM
jgi:hypothetical protein